MAVANQNISPQRKLEENLRKLLDDERFFDISLKCSDEKTLRACKNILCVRSEVFNDHIFDKSKESTNQSIDQLGFDKINSIAMKYILEYLYTSRNEREELNVDNVVEVYYSAIYFKLDDLQGDIIKFTNQRLREGEEDLGKKLLSDYIEKFTLEADNAMGQLLVNWVAKIQLFPDDAGRDSLSLPGLQYLLSKTFNTTKSFATYELTLFEYTLVKTTQTITEEKIGLNVDPYDMEKNYEQGVIERIKNRLKPLLPYIDLRIIDSEDVLKIEPLNIFPQDMITDAYRFRMIAAKKSDVLQPMRGCMIFKWKNYDKEIWQTENKLYVIDNGFTVKADSNLKTYKSIMGDLIIKCNGIHKWDILIEDLSETIYIGICGIDEQFDKPGDGGFKGWALGSDGYVYYKKTWYKHSDVYRKGDVVNIVVNMNIRQCYFGVNGVINREVFGHSFPDEIYPFASFKKGCKLHVLPY